MSDNKSTSHRSDTSPELAATETLREWTQAFTASDVARIVALYADDALFFGTRDKTLASGLDPIRTYFEIALSRDLPRGARIDERHIKVLSEEVVLMTGLDTVTGTRDGQSYASRGRFSFIIQKQGGQWKIVHFHRSALPA